VLNSEKICILQKQIPAEKQHQLELPCQFEYADGVIERVQFHAEDAAWSENVKRAVLNMIQLNLKKNNAQGLRISGGQQPSAEEEAEGKSAGLGRTFNIPEVSGSFPS
jgi:hypothetical protein